MGENLLVKCGILSFLQRLEAFEGSVAKLARIRKPGEVAPNAVAEDEKKVKRLPQFSFPLTCSFSPESVGRWPLAVKVAELSWEAPIFSNQDCAFAKRTPPPRLTLEPVRCHGPAGVARLLTSTALPLPALNAPSRARTGAA